MTAKREPVEKSAPLRREECTTPDLEELLGRWVSAINRRDVDASMSFFAPDAVWERWARAMSAFEG
jgi:ketosteroid isomerase-like protein